MEWKRTSSARIAAVTGVVIAACAGNGVQAGGGAAEISDEAIRTASETITPADMYREIAHLASDDMAGRDTPSPGLEAAADYVAGRFAVLGLRPGVGDGEFLQRYPLPLRALDAETVHFGTVGPDGNRMLEYGVDFFVAPAKPFEDAEMGHGELVYLGDGTREEWAPGESVEGQVAVVRLPGEYDREWRIAAARLRRIAGAAGARALMVILDPGFSEEAFQSRRERGERQRRELISPHEIPVFYVRHAAAREVLQRSGIELEDPEASLQEPIVLEGLDAHFNASATVIDSQEAPNVVAVLPGNDPELRESYVVLSAHMDHVGFGRADASGDSIYNGADDNATGTATLVEVAEAFASMETPPARSIVFLAVSGEEKGLLGSRYYVDHPTVPLESIVANINIDMIGRNAPDSIVVIGQEYSSLGPLVHQMAEEHPETGLRVSGDPWPEERFFFRSDHFNFARSGIPALFFFAGVHEDYHRPSDEADMIDSDKAARVARLVFLTAHEIASAPTPPTWTDRGRSEVRSLTR